MRRVLGLLLILLLVATLAVAPATVCALDRPAPGTVLPPPRPAGETPAARCFVLPLRPGFAPERPLRGPPSPARLSSASTETTNREVTWRDALRASGEGS